MVINFRFFYSVIGRYSVRHNMTFSVNINFDTLDKCSNLGGLNLYPLQLKSPADTFSGTEMHSSHQTLLLLN